MTGSLDTILQAHSANFSAGSPLDYEAIEKALLLQNFANVVSLLKDGDKSLFEQIRSFCDKFDFNEGDVVDKIQNDKMFAAHFAKTPSRMGFHARAAGEWLDKVLEPVVIKRLSTKNNQVWVNSDGVIEAVNKHETRQSKSLDFCWSINDKTFYAVHKYTRGPSGGSQDKQFQEMSTLLKNFQRASHPDKILIVIVDGLYYTSKRMKNLRNFTRLQDPKSFATPLHEVPDIVEEYKKQ